ncbi:hypothetical protein RRG08_011513 [Elysia crispata]|uniref:Uncharacterized protein n=1 Tax=Elysia crispata TaxID=231223 RepID=A0AAE1E4R5_9GAST|nr:hypothetical protein RRG08_011513 [Elysia crispata]
MITQAPPEVALGLDLHACSGDRRRAQIYRGSVSLQWKRTAPCCHHLQRWHVYLRAINELVNLGTNRYILEKINPILFTLKKSFVAKHLLIYLCEFGDEFTPEGLTLGKDNYNFPDGSRKGTQTGVIHMQERAIIMNIKQDLFSEV